MEELGDFSKKAKGRYYSLQALSPLSLRHYNGIHLNSQETTTKSKDLWVAINTPCTWFPKYEHPIRENRYHKKSPKTWEEIREQWMEKLCAEISMYSIGKMVNYQIPMTSLRAEAESVLKNGRILPKAIFF